MVKLQLTQRFSQCLLFSKFSSYDSNYYAITMKLTVKRIQTKAPVSRMRTRLIIYVKLIRELSWDVEQKL